ncbi:hypothetical protein Gasu2_48570 [Galdieria sulphuraria]|uniref:QXW lectin repeat-containing protein n=1 Tax=Galdieria sulphuraria TaxID=130081 RepID=M2XFA9_GALSU|nr:QXW lectin repeat-containing protein [Galdieria sulphuraria]EME28687.1 QXW lectin repeat-containing protein [Galdieria sulphuraria]GJD10678.1 hypothetical protein Gasu2_48570 [Galdieria sulphuraria]|eukprot:XP_005705207.1 QXW lectin repeat-containing protein [Galdieria sulphuraria]
MSWFFSILFRLDNNFKLFKLWPLLFIGLFLFISRDSSEQQLIPLLYQQQSLYKDVPLPAVQVAGTHNSYCSTHYGYNLCNNGEIPRHFLSLTQQLDRGFRLLELDVHYIPQMNDTNTTSKTDSSAFRLCHPCGDGCFWLSLICLKHFPDYGKEHRGCSHHALTLEKAFREIMDWLRRYPDEFVFLYLDSFIYDEAAGMALNNWVQNWSHSLAFSQQDLKEWRFNNGISSDSYDGWPSIRQLLKMGKQLIIDSRIDNTVVDENSFIFPDLSNIRWPFSQLQYLEPLDEQIMKKQDSSAFQQSSQKEQWLGCAIRSLSESEEPKHVYFPFFSRMVWEGHLTDRAWKLLKDAVQCGYSFRVDIPNLSSWTRILEIFEWSFSTLEETSRWVKGHSCTKLSTGKWMTVNHDENELASVACVCEEWHSTNYSLKQPRGYRQSWWCTSSRYPCLSKTQGNQLCNRTKPSSCASASFSCPVTALENEILKYTMKDFGVDSVWIISNDE